MPSWKEPGNQRPPSLQKQEVPGDSASEGMKGLGRLHTPGAKVWRGGEGQDGGAGSAGCLGLRWSMTAEELLPDVTLALEAAEFRGSLLLLYLSSRTVPLEEGGFLRTLGGPFGLHQWKSSSICQPQLPILETAKRDIKKGADVRMCAGRGWGRLGPFMLRAFLSVWGRGRGFGQMLSFRSSPPISLHTPTRSSPPISLHTPTRVSWVATQGLLRPPVSLTGRSLPPQGAQMSPFHLQSGPRTFMRGQPEAPGTGPSWSLSEWGSFPASTACFQASGKGALRLQARHSSVAKHTAWGLLSPLLLWT
ncbi:uncharacterized protein LOC132359594 isoform X5 [Balaenoptera ricei]|uniref:uncharacterized protein LOC132359594 isoform X5 n=1 Tax=Balaenoptera ricei TaxID=2746895 RepID=UPI0028BF4CE5|nr:uncharacterized protein LOC132359594 isoform X5 [Balaenoptera ricei]